MTMKYTREVRQRWGVFIILTLGVTMKMLTFGEGSGGSFFEHITHLEVKMMSVIWDLAYQKPLL